MAHARACQITSQNEEARAADAATHLRQRCQSDTLGPSMGPACGIGHVKSQSSAAFGETSPRLALPINDGADLPLVVYKLEKTYNAPFLQRCLCCCSRIRFCGSPRSRCCKQARTTRALNGVSFCVPRGSCLAYIGMSDYRKDTHS